MGDALVLDRYGEEARLAEIFYVDVTLDLDLVLVDEIRKRWRMGGLRVARIGEPADLTYAVEDLGASPDVLAAIADGTHAFAQQRFLCLPDQVVERGVELVVVEFRFDLVQRLGEFVFHVDTNGAEG